MQNFFAAFISFFILAIAYAVARGGKTERQVAAVFVAGWLATQLVKFPAAQQYVTVNLWVLSVDTVMLGLLVAIMLRGDRRWPVFVVSLQGLLMLAHLIKLIQPGYIARAYATLTVCWTFMQLGLLVWGAARHRRSRKSIFLPPSSQLPTRIVRSNGQPR